MVQSDLDLMAALAVTRFGLGARPGELAKAKPDPRAWLKSQISNGAVAQPRGDLPGTPERLSVFREYRQARQDAQQSQTPVRQGMAIADATGLQDEAVARTRLGAESDTPFAERWALFWANHFTVSAIKAQSAPLAGPFEREAIRPYVFGRFVDMAMASSRHPGMLVYLDQAQSVGPNSRAAQRQAAVQRSAGLNENLAREILELHTVGVHGGYTQADVTEFARAMTGWSLGAEAEGPDKFGRFVYRPQTHEPGERTVMGKAYADAGEDQAGHIIVDLAAHPATARHVATKIAAHFVADDPPPALVGKLEQAFTDSHGDLAVVAAALVDADEAWADDSAKFKTPYELVVSTYRAADMTPSRPAQVVQPLNQLGQPCFRAPSPKGWPDEALSWAAPDAILKRLTWAKDIAGQVAQGDREPLKVAQDSLGARLRPETASAIISAESREEALTILFMSPEFQRR